MTMLKIIVLGLRAGGSRDYAQGQARHAAGAAAPGSGDRDHAPATAPEPAGVALEAMNNRRFPPPEAKKPSHEAREQSANVHAHKYFYIDKFCDLTSDHDRTPLVAA